MSSGCLKFVSAVLQENRVHIAKTGRTRRDGAENGGGDAAAAGSGFLRIAAERKNQNPASLRYLPGKDRKPRRGAAAGKMKAGAAVLPESAPQKTPGALLPGAGSGETGTVYE